MPLLIFFKVFRQQIPAHKIEELLEDIKPRTSRVRACNQLAKVYSSFASEILQTPLQA